MWSPQRSDASVMCVEWHIPSPLTHRGIVCVSGGSAWRQGEDHSPCRPLYGPELLPMTHKLFPLGLNCAHCATWRSLEDAIHHIDQAHPDCANCGAERGLAAALVEKAIDSVRMAGRRSKPVGLTSGERGRSDALHAFDERRAALDLWIQPPLPIRLRSARPKRQLPPETQVLR